MRGTQETTKRLQIGNWDTSKAVRLFTYNYPSWTVTVEGISKKSEPEFKFIKKKNGSVIWEDSIQNRGLIVSENYTPNAMVQIDFM